MYTKLRDESIQVHVTPGYLDIFPFRPDSNIGRTSGKKYFFLKSAILNTNGQCYRY